MYFPLVATGVQLHSNKALYSESLSEVQVWVLQRYFFFLCWTESQQPGAAVHGRAARSTEEPPGGTTAQPDCRAALEGTAGCQTLTISAWSKQMGCSFRHLMAVFQTGLSIPIKVTYWTKRPVKKSHARIAQCLPAELSQVSMQLPALLTLLPQSKVCSLHVFPTFELL